MVDPSRPDEMQALFVVAKLTMVRYRNALQAIRDRAASAGDRNIERLAAVALRDQGREVNGDA